MSEVENLKTDDNIDTKEDFIEQVGAVVVSQQRAIGNYFQNDGSGDNKAAQHYAESCVARTAAEVMELLDGSTEEDADPSEWGYHVVPRRSRGELSGEIGHNTRLADALYADLEDKSS